MRIIKQTQKVFSNGYKGIVRYKSLVRHPHVNLVETTHRGRPFRSLSAGQGILTFMFFLLSLSFGPCLEVRRCLAGACHTVFHASVFNRRQGCLHRLPGDTDRRPVARVRQESFVRNSLFRHREMYPGNINRSTTAVKIS